MYSMPLSAQACCSSGSMGRDASEIWVSPAQKASKPSPVPAPPTEIFTSEFSWLNASAAACVMGRTVLEPSTASCPETPPPPLCPLAPPPQAARTSDRARRRPATNQGLERLASFKPTLLSPRARLHHKCTVSDQKTARPRTRLSGHDDRA